jgi:transposase
MRDHELYATILGVQAPWRVERVELDVPGGAVHVWLARDGSAAAECPECHTAQTIYDHRDREWRHLDTCQLQTRLHARVPRVDCPTHGVLQSPVPWATPGSKFTLLFERLATDWLREAAVTAVARQLKLGWDAVWASSAGPLPAASRGAACSSSATSASTRSPFSGATSS